MRDNKGQTSIEKPKTGYRAPFIAITLLLFLTSIGLLTITHPQSLISLRSLFMDSYAHIITKFDAVVYHSKETLLALTNFMQREEDMERLTRESRELMQWRHIALKLHAENDSLKKLLQFVPEGRHDFVTARVLTLSQDAYKVATLNVGLSHNVHKGNAVLGKRGIIGRVIEVTEKTSKVLLLHDPLSKVPVKVEGKEISALVAGDYTGKLKLLYVSHDSPLIVGDRLITSNEGGVFPAGFFVGTVQAIHEDEIKVTSPENLTFVDFVIVLRQGVQ